LNFENSMPAGHGSCRGFHQDHEPILRSTGPKHTGLTSFRKQDPMNLKNHVTARCLDDRSPHSNALDPAVKPSQTSKPERAIRKDPAAHVSFSSDSIVKQQG
jgi:hypothetical protein